MNALLKLSGGIDAINRTIGRIFAWILLPMICLTAFEVFSRYVLKSPTVWAWELIIQIWGLMLMACGGYCYWKGGLVRVDLLYNKFPVKVRCGINIATAILVLICMALVFIYGINIFLLSFRLNERISSVWGSPMWTIRFWVPLGAALMFIQAISELIKNVAAMAGKIELTNNSDEVAEAIEIVKSAEHLPDETGKEDIQ